MITTSPSMRTDLQSLPLRSGSVTGFSRFIRARTVLDHAPGFPRAPATRIGGNHDQRERQEPRAQECSRLGGSLTLDEASATPPESARRAGLKYWRTPARSACGVFGDLVRVECQEIRCGQEKW